MNNSYFLKKSHVGITSHTIIIYIIIIVFVISKFIKDSELSMPLIFVVAFTTVITNVIVKYDNSIGLYINGMNIYYKNIKAREIDFNEIVGVKIIQAYSAGKYRGFYPLKNQKGELLYSAIMLKSLTDEMCTYKKGDLWFNKDFKNYIICSVIYDKNAINYLKNINPNIKIIQ